MNRGVVPPELAPVSYTHLDVYKRQEQVNALKPQLPPLATLSDLIDVSEDAGPEAYRVAIEAASKAPQIDGVLAIYSPKMNIDGDAIATAIAGFNRHMSKPLLTCWTVSYTHLDVYKRQVFHERRKLQNELLERA